MLPAEGMAGADGADRLATALSGAWPDLLATELLLPTATALILVIVRLRLWRRRSARRCSWRKGVNAPGRRSQMWVCRRCGVDAFSYDGRPPKECKRGLRPAAL